MAIICSHFCTLLYSKVAQETGELRAPVELAFALHTEINAQNCAQIRDLNVISNIILSLNSIYKVT